MGYKKTLTDYIKARYSLLVIESFEEERVIKELGQISKEINHTMFVWNSTEGVTLNGAVVGDKTNDFKLAIDFCESKAKEKDGRFIFVFCDAHNYLDSKANAVYRRRLKDFAMNIRSKGYKCNCIIVCPSFEINNDLQKEITIVDFPLPDREEVKAIVTSNINGYKGIPGVTIDVNDSTLEKFVDASIGLTRLEIENCLAKAIVSDHRLDENDIKGILNEKKQIIRKTGILEFIDTK